mmetsp:Transcript_8690/g.18814  ORF Transcript_8690/g.18814 Transcript_8690/m.18814 type:complete len:120 (-) Transcript_8690:840-1199(-)
MLCCVRAISIGYCEFAGLGLDRDIATLSSVSPSQTTDFVCLLLSSPTNFLVVVHITGVKVVTTQSQAVDVKAIARKSVGSNNGATKAPLSATRSTPSFDLIVEVTRHQDTGLVGVDDNM